MPKASPANSNSSFDGRRKKCQCYICPESSKRKNRMPNGCDTSSVYQNFLKVPATECQNSVKFRHHEITCEGDGSNFPFKTTSSGNFKVQSEQVVFESNKFSVIVADPAKTKICYQSRKMTQQYVGGAVTPSCSQVGAAPPAALVMQLFQLHISGQNGTNNDPSDDNTKDTAKILCPELNLLRLGYTENDPIDWGRVALPEKRNLYAALKQRIANRNHTDCKVYVESQEFNCHLLVLQTYSDMIDSLEAFKKLELSADKCSASSFALIYDWMTHPGQSYTSLTRENVLDIFIGAKYLKIGDLVEQCWAFIDNSDVFSEDTAFLLYLKAKDKRIEEVKHLMLPRIQTFFLVLVSSEDWLKLDVEDIKCFLSSNYICVNCEMEVFASAVRWLRYDWEVRQKCKLEVFNCIRFGNIATWQLVDIKRNPINPEYLELAEDPAVCKLIDDGLAYATIQNWYNKTEAMNHLNTVLQLEEPTPRHWIDPSLVHLSYKDFLIYLDRYRKEQLLYKFKTVTKTEKKSEFDMTTAFYNSEGATEPSEHQIVSNKTVLVYSLHKFDYDKKTNNKLDGGGSSFEVIRNLSEYEESYRRKELSKMFSPSKNRFSLENKDVMSVSVLAPNFKDYLAENSLFLYERESLLVFGGIDPYSRSGIGRNTGKLVYRYEAMSNLWQFMGELPEPRQHHRVQFLSGRVYLAGGSDPRVDELRKSAVVMDTVWSFDPVMRAWFSEGSLSVPRKKFGLVAIHKSMYAIGGQDRQLNNLHSVERFDPIEGLWSQKAPLLLARYGFGTSKYRDHIWVAGGLNNTGEMLSGVESYDLHADQWTQITDLTFPRCFFCMFVMSDRLFLIGGAAKTYYDNDMPANTSVDGIETWDTNTMSWKFVTKMAIPRHGHAVAYLGTQIFILGGVTTVYMRSLPNTECFCIRRDKWVRGIAELPARLAGFDAITLPPSMCLSM